MGHELALATGTGEIALLSSMANRHGLIAGATGTGKTITLRVLAEKLSRIGVPVFLADVKGDLTGLGLAGEGHPKVLERVAALGLAYEPAPCPVRFWDVFGEYGLPVRATVSEMGPLLLARLLGLNETQSGLLALVFKVADDGGLLLLDLKDLRAMLDHVGQNASRLRTAYGNVSAASVGAIQRGLLALEQQGADRFFGERALDLEDLLQVEDGQGVVNVLAAERLMRAPAIYSTFLLWLLSELFERLPEVGDADKPRLVFFFDEAHLLFADAPRALRDRLEQVVRLIRSKGVGVYFCTQSPLDIPDAVLGQLGNRVQHALRAFTPRDQRAVRAAAETFRTNPALDTATAITELRVGEALVSFLDEKGMPGIVERALIHPPRTRLEPLSADERRARIEADSLRGTYAETVDRESAYEMLKRSAPAGMEAPPAASPTPRTKSASATAASIAGAFVTSAARSLGTQLGRSILRSVLGNTRGGARRR